MGYLNKSMHNMSQTSDDQAIGINDVVKSLSEKELILTAVAFIFVACVSLIGNTATLAAFCKCKILRTKYNIAILSLTVSDILGGFLSLNVGISLFTTRIYALKAQGQFILTTLIMFPASSNQCHMILIAVERYIAVIYPLSYMRTYTKKIAAICVAVTWITSIFATFFTAMISFSGANGNANVVSAAASKLNSFKLNLVDTVFHSSVCLFISCLYIHMMYRIRFCRNTPSQSTKEAVMKGRKGLVITCVLVVYFIISWTPFVIGKTIAAHLQEIYMYKVLLYFVLLAHTNFANNHVIFVLLNPKFRQVFKDFLCCSKFKQPQVIST